MPLQFAARRAGTSGVLDFVSLVGISLGELVFYGCKMPMEEVIAYRSAYVMLSRAPPMQMGASVLVGPGQAVQVR